MIVPALGCLAFIFHRARPLALYFCFLKIGRDVICKWSFAPGAGKVILAPFVPLDLERLGRLMKCARLIIAIPKRKSARGFLPVTQVNPKLRVIAARLRESRVGIN